MYRRTFIDSFAYNLLARLQASEHVLAKQTPAASLKRMLTPILANTDAQEAAFEAIFEQQPALHEQLLYTKCRRKASATRLAAFSVIALIVTYSGIHLYHPSQQQPFKAQSQPQKQVVVENQPPKPIVRPKKDGLTLVEYIPLKNPSFEDEPKAGQSCRDWYNCGDPQESPPDVQPGFFQVSSPAVKGATYLGMVVRNNGTSEAVVQQLPSYLLEGKKYQWSVYLAKSNFYMSFVKNHSRPVILQIWGGNAYCERGELLSSSALVKHAEWRAYTFQFVPKYGNWNYILLEAADTGQMLFPGDGNILLDACSPITLVK